MIKKSSPKKSSPKRKLASFPAAYEAQNGNSGLVVIFISRNVGMVLVESENSSGNYPVGSVSHWAPCDNKELWKPIDVTISHQ